MLKSVLDLIWSETESCRNQKLCKFALSGLRAEITSFTMEEKWAEYKRAEE